MIRTLTDNRKFMTGCANYIADSPDPAETLIIIELREKHWKNGGRAGGCTECRRRRHQNFNRT